MLRKKAQQDLQNSLNRFTDLGRDPVSRAKHFRNAYECLSVQGREVHKVAVIYVAKDQQDKHSILSNSCGSETFNNYVGGLGWMVQIGSPHFNSYTVSLSNGQLVPYFCSANTELIFHVSTLLNGGNTQRLKHLGNEEVHVAWSENNSKPYRRDLIATCFCDVLIVL